MIKEINECWLSMAPMFGFALAVVIPAAALTGLIGVLIIYLGWWNVPFSLLAFYVFVPLAGNFASRFLD